MKTAFLIKVRLGSTRLPGKAMLEVDGVPLIRHMIRRLKAPKIKDLQVIICTSVAKENDLLEQVASEEGVDIFRGDDDDVLQRYYDAAIHFGCDYILKSGADNPLVATDWIERVIQAYQEKQPGLIMLTDLPIGCFFYGIDIRALRSVLDRKTETRTEVWGHIFQTLGIPTHMMEIPSALQRPNYRLTVDYPEDFEVVRNVIEAFGDRLYHATTDEIITVLDQHPEWTTINQKNIEKYQKNIDI